MVGGAQGHAVAACEFALMPGDRRARSPIVVPGLGLSPASWAPTVRLLGTAATFMTLPGYGRPAPPGTDLGPPAQAARLCTRARLGGRVLVGHSASCQIMVEAAARSTRAGEPPAALLLVGPTTDPSGSGWVRLAGRWLRTARHEPPCQIPLLARDYLRTGLGGMARAMNAARKHAVQVALAITPCPVVVVRGTHDRIAPEPWTVQLARVAPAGRAVTLPAGGHMVPLTHPTLLAPQLSGLIEKVCAT